MPERVLGYIDGFNLFGGLKESGWTRYLWYDPCLLVSNLLTPQQVLVGVKYFTTRLSGPGDSWECQKTFLEALECQSKCVVHFGQYQRDPRSCPQCGASSLVWKEKMTDVNIAVEIVSDGFQDAYDTALLISGDSDLVPALQKLKVMSGKRKVVAFPPKRTSRSLAAVCPANFVIGRAKLAASQFPDEVVKPDGTRLHRPLPWR